MKPQRRRMFGLVKPTPANAPTFRYSGGKGLIRRYLVRWCILNGSTFCEPFAGRGNMFFLMRTLAHFKKWHLNDFQTIPFFKAILEYDGWPIEKFDRDEARDLFEIGDPRHILLEPMYYWAGGLAAMGASPTGNMHYSDEQLIHYQQKLLRAKKLLQGVKFTEVDACDIIKFYSNDENAFLYVDPPYLDAKVASYDDTMVMRKRMIKLLKHAKCKWMFSEYDVPDAFEAFGEPLTIIKDLALQPNGIASRAAQRRKEYVWTNYEIEPHRMGMKLGGNPENTSVRLLEKVGSTTYQKWCDITPRCWTPKKKKSEWNQLKYHPRCYYDGKSIRIIR